MWLSSGEILKFNGFNCKKGAVDMTGVRGGGGGAVY